MDELIDPPRPPIGWAVVELLGHRRELGYLAEEEIAGARFLRLDSPLFDENGDQDDTDRKYFSTNAVYAITPTSEQAVRDELAPWVACRAPVDDPNDLHGGTCALRKGHAGDHDPDDGLPF